MIRLFGRAGVHRVTHGRNDGIQIERFPDDLIDARRSAGESFHPGGIRAGDYEDTAFQDRLAQMLKEAPVWLIGRRDVIFRRTPSGRCADRRRLDSPYLMASALGTMGMRPVDQSREFA